MTTLPFQTDKDGNLVLEPLIGFGTQSIMDAAVFLTLVTASSPDHLPDGDRRLQAVLSPTQALELGEKLQTVARSLLAQRPETPVN